MVSFLSNNMFYIHVYSFVIKGHCVAKKGVYPGPAEPRYALPLQTVYIKFSWFLKKPAHFDLHCLYLSM